MLRKRSVLVNGRKTAVSIEDKFWDAAKTVAASKDMTLIELVSDIDTNRGHRSLSSAVRVAIMEHFRSLCSRTAQVMAAIALTRELMLPGLLS